MEGGGREGGRERGRGRGERERVYFLLRLWRAGPAELQPFGFTYCSPDHLTEIVPDWHFRWKLMQRQPPAEVLLH